MSSQLLCADCTAGYPLCTYDETLPHSLASRSSGSTRLYMIQRVINNSSTAVIFTGEFRSFDSTQPIHEFLPWSQQPAILAYIGTSSKCKNDTCLRSRNPPREGAPWGTISDNTVRQTAERLCLTALWYQEFDETSYKRYVGGCGPHALNDPLHALSKHPQFLKLPAAFSMIVAYETIRGSFFSTIVRLRTDIVWLKPLPLLSSTIALGDAYVAGDHMAILPRSKAEAYFGVAKVACNVTAKKIGDLVNATDLPGDIYTLNRSSFGPACFRVTIQEAFLHCVRTYCPVCFCAHAIRAHQNIDCRLCQPSSAGGVLCVPPRRRRRRMSIPSEFAHAMRWLA